MHFRVFGPYELPREGWLISTDREDQRFFWENVNLDADGLSRAHGCYVFTIRNRPWYVGMAERQPFARECLGHHKLSHYNAALQAVTGRPRIYLVAQVSPSGRFTARQQSRAIRMLETLLIGMALQRNTQLRNIQGTKLIREMNVPGILNSTRGQARSAPVQGLKRALGI